MASIFTTRKITVPGLLPDDALQEQLKQFGQAKQAENAAAPPPASAVEFSDRVIDGFLKPETMVPEKRPNPPAPSQSPVRIEQNQRIEQNSDSMADIMGPALLTNPITGPGAAVMGLLSQAGTLTAEESEVATQQRAEDMRQREQAIRSKAEVRAKLRGMTDEQAGSLGLPTAPGGTDLAQQAENALQDASTVESAASKTKTAEAATRGEAAPVTQTWWLNSAQTAVRSAAQLGTGALRGLAVWLEQPDALRGLDERSEARVWIDTVDAAITKLLPGDKARSQDFVTELSAGAGSFAGFMLAGYIGALGGAPVAATTGVLGALVGGGQAVAEAEQFDATSTQKFLALIAGTGLGLTEAIPIDRMFMRADAASGGLVRRMLRNSLAGSMEEFIQEASQALGEDITAKYLAGFDPDRDIDPREIARRGLIGALTGAAGGLVAGGGAPTSETGPLSLASPETREAHIQAAIEDAQLVFDQIEGINDAEGELPPAEQTAPAVEGVDIPEAMRAAGSVEAATFKGGTMPALRQDGKIELTHWSDSARATLDPAQRGRGPLRGQERQRLFGADAVDRTYYGVEATATRPKRSLPEYLKKREAQEPTPRGASARERQTIRQQRERDFYAEARRGPYVREGGLGDARHTVAVDPDELYNWYEDPQGLKKGLDRSLADSEQVTQYERLIRDAGFAGYYVDQSDLGQTVALFDARTPESVVSERTGEALQPDPLADFDARFGQELTPEQETQRRERAMQSLAEKVPGITGAMKYMTAPEKARLSAAGARKIVSVFENLPSAEEMAAVAIAGKAKRGWYERSARAFIDVFGLQDAPRFAALLAALSPQTSVESNAINALTTWANWIKAGRPTDPKRIKAILGRSVQGGGGQASVLPAWLNNSIEALTNPDTNAINLSGPKVTAFMKNLQGITNEVTNDTWMANFANIEQTVFKGTWNTKAKRNEVSPGYTAMAAMTRAAAEAATNITGETWTPAEVQETVWSWTKALYEMREKAGEERSAAEIVAAGALTDDQIASVPDFASLFVGGVYRNILEKGGYGDQIEALARGGSADAGDGQRGGGEAPQGTGFAVGAFEGYLQAAANRLDTLIAARTKRGDTPEEALQASSLAHLSEDDLSDFLGMTAAPERLPGLPKSSSGPIPQIVAAAEAYAVSRGLPLRRQRTYVNADPERGARIAAAYEAMAHDPADPAVAASYQALIDETLAQFQFVKATGLKIEFIAEGQADPYPEGPKQVLADLQRGHLWVFPTDQGFGTLNEAEATNPLLAPTDEFIDGRQLLANDVFRIVHDFFGHGLEGAGFGARGEENAWQAHMRLFSPAAVPAMTSETRGQNSWVNFGPHGEGNRANQRETVYADQKTGLMPEWTWTEGVEDDADLDAIMGGVSAAGERSDALGKAMRLFDEGVDPVDIWNTTGFYRGVDGFWRFEIADDDARFSKKFLDHLEQYGSINLADWNLGAVVNHPNLYEAYPALRQVTIDLKIAPMEPRQENGAFYENGAAGRITVEAATPIKAMSIVLHEIQHWVQTQEGFARGGNTAMGQVFEGHTVETLQKDIADLQRQIVEPGRTDASRAVLERRLLDKTIQMDTAAGFEYYRRLAGEVEARLVQQRFESYVDEWMAFDKHKENPSLASWVYGVEPASEEDVPRYKQRVIVARSPSGPSRSQMLSNDVDAAIRAPGTAAARVPYVGEQTRNPQGTQQTGQEPNDASLAVISRNFIKLLNLTTRQGRLSLKGSSVMGQYRRSAATVRLRTWNDLSTLVHEGGHAFHDAATGPLLDYINVNARGLIVAANKLYAGGQQGGQANQATMLMTPDVLRREGFAEFFRVYTLNRAYAAREFPQLTAEFSQLLAREAPTMQTGLDAIGLQFMAYLQAPSTEVLSNQIVSGYQDTGISAAIGELRQQGFRSWMQEVGRRTVRDTINRFQPLNQLVNEILNVGEKNKGVIDLKRAEDPRVLARLAANSGSRAMIELTDGVLPYKGTQSFTRGLRDAILISQGLKPTDTPGAFNEERLKDFSTFLVALRALDEYRRFKEGKLARPPIGLGLGDVQQVIDDMMAKYGDSFTEAAAIVHEFGMGLWKKQFDAGLMSKDTYDAGLDRRFYVPLQRDMSDKKAQLGASAITGGRSLVKTFRGSDRDIVDPLAVLMHKTFALEKAIAQNDIVVTLAKLADRAGTSGALVERVPAQVMMPNTFTVEEVARQLTKDDTISEMDAQDLMTILDASIENESVISLFRQEQASAKGENIMFYWEAGKVAAIQLKDGEVGADVINLFNGLGRENMQWGVELIAGTSTAFRNAITMWPDFLLVNFIRDQFSAWILTDVGFKPFWTGLKGVGDELRQRTWAKQANAAQMLMGGMNVSTLHEARLNRDIDALRAKGYFARVFKQEPGVMGKVKGFSHVMELTETGSRLGLFRGAFERAKRDGLDDYEASVEAGYLATDYIDFGLNGSRMLLLRRTIPFLNAQLQGLYKMMRTLGADEVRQRKGLQFVLAAYFKGTKGLPLSRVERDAINTGRKAWIKMVGLAGLSAFLHFLFSDDEDYQEVGEYARATGWVIPVGEGRIVYIPKPFELALLANAVERGLEYASGDKEAVNRFKRGMALTLLPPTSPPVIQLGVEYAANKDFFTGGEIVPDYMQALAPELQYNNYTSELAKEVGQRMGWSPMVIDHFLSGLGASAYRDVATMTNALDPTSPSIDFSDAPITRRFVRDVKRGSATSRDFWAQASKLNGKLETAANSYKAYLEGGNEVAANNYLSSLSEDERAFAVLDTHFKADAKRLNPFYRARQINTVVSAMRREIASDLGLESTEKGLEGVIPLSPRQKRDIDELLSEYARREMRNTMVVSKTPGWSGKAMLDVSTTDDLINLTVPEVQVELRRRLNKAKVYDAETVYEAWPDARDRLLVDREQAFLDDLTALAKATTP